MTQSASRDVSDSSNEMTQSDQEQPLKHLARRFTLHGERQSPLRNPVALTSFLCGLCAGSAQAALFNPYDRALYLAVKERRSFLALQNWEQPFIGFYQSLGGKALSSGLYFPVEHLFLRWADPMESKPARNFVAGTAAGAVNATILNPLAAIKYKTWGKESNRGMWVTAQRMLQKADGSVRPFLNGIRPTLYRDVIFGGCYTWMRLQLQVWYELPHEQQWQANCVAAAFATILSGPMNYARTIQLATPSRKTALSTWVVLTQLGVETAEQPTRLKQLRFLASRLRIGWGTARVALGIAFGHFVYDYLVELSNQTQSW